VQDAGTYPGELANADVAYFDQDSGNCTLDLSPANPLGGIYCNYGYGYLGDFDFGSYTLDVDGVCIVGSRGGSLTASAGAEIECSGLFIKFWALAGGGSDFPSNLTVTLNGTGLVYCYGNTGADLVIDAAGTHTADDSAYWDSFLLSNVGSTYVDGGYTHTIAGSIVASNGALTSTGKWIMTGDGNLAANSVSLPVRLFHELEIAAGVSANLSLGTYFKKATVNATASLTMDPAASFYCYLPTANNFLDMAGTIDQTAGTGVLTIVYLDTGGASNTGKIAGDVFRLIADNDDALTETGTISANTTQIYGVSDNNAAKLVIEASGSALGEVSLGTASGTDRHGLLDLGSGAYTVSMTSLANAVTTTDPPTNELDFGDAFITLSGTMNGQYITCSGNAVSTVGATVEGGTIQNVDVSGYAHIDARGIYGSQPVDGGGNDNVRFARGLVGGGVL